MNKYIVSKSVVYESFKDDLFTGYAPTVPKVPEVEPWLSYIGPKITFSTWRELLAFFAWSYEKTKSEAQARFYFNKESGLWRAWAFPPGTPAKLSPLLYIRTRLADTSFLQSATASTKFGRRLLVLILP